LFTLVVIIRILCALSTALKEPSHGRESTSFDQY
jgi:hypothetical protein